MKTVPSMLTKSTSILQLKIWSFQREISLWGNTSLNIVVQRLILKGTFSIYVREMKKVKRSAQHQKVETATK